jgi:hypothetical protein
MVQARCFMAGFELLCDDADQILDFLNDDSWLL